MKIVATSPSFSKNPELEKEIYSYFPNAKLNLEGKRFSKNELIEFIGDADGVIVGLEKIDDEVLEKCQNVRIVSKYGVGLNNLEFTKENVKIGWTGGVNKLSVAEMTLGYFLMLSRNLYQTSNQLKDGIWNKSGGFQLSGKTVGIIGVGHIGKEVIRLLEPFNCKILVNDIIEQDEYYKSVGATEVSKDEIYKQSDFITIHTPFDKTTENLIGKKEFETMKKSAFVVNSARGGIIDEVALKNALLSGEISGGAIDAYVSEPPEDKELLTFPNLITTPHIGGNSREAILAMGKSAISHLKNFFL
ncbi:phosphoglycerate dehydrogenase-like oxidoreductase [Thiovulum sp. ES]|nr:phosphoglycerate dehydrogenase-like oxidoreductase [Thiovulum sp. ES]